MPSHGYDDAERVLRNARTLRDGIRRALENAREHDTRESLPSRGWLGVRLQHPLWSLGTLARVLLRLGVVRSAVTWLGERRTHSEPLPLALPQRVWTDPRREQGALYWLGPVTIRHRTLTALLCQPNGRVECRTTVAPDAALHCACGVAPRVWRERPPAIDFTIRVASAAGGWTREAVRRIDARRITDRRWHDVRIDLPRVSDSAEPVVVSLSTSVPPGADPAHAEALFGEPRFVWRR